MDTKYFAQALAEYTDKLVCELTTHELSYLMQRAQELKELAEKPKATCTAADWGY